MGVARTRTIKNKHATNKSGIKNSRANKKGAGPADGVLKPSASARKKGTAPKTRPLTPAEMLRKKMKKKKYTPEELGVPELNKITPIGVTKPKGKKKGKVFVDDKESMDTIMSIVQAEKEGQLESKIMKARQMEEIREARKKEAESREAAKNGMLEDVKNSLRKKRKRSAKDDDEDKVTVKSIANLGSKATKKRKQVSFAA